MTSDLQHQKVVALSNIWPLGSHIYKRSLLYCCCYTVLWISYFRTQSSDTVNINIQWLVVQLNLGTEKENKDDKIVNTVSIKKMQLLRLFRILIFLSSLSTDWKSDNHQYCHQTLQLKYKHPIFEKGTMEKLNWKHF